MSDIKEDLDLVYTMIHAYTELQSDNLTIYERKILITNNLLPFIAIKNELKKLDQVPMLIKKLETSGENTKQETIDILKGWLK